jgi:ABC-2 type transport system ATP-binding protein
MSAADKKERHDSDGKRPKMKSDVRRVDKPMVACEHASKWYGQIVGCNDLTLEIGPGIMGLLGPNGAGKSTLLKLMTGQLQPSKGTVEVLGQRAWSNRALMRRIGYCPEHEGVYEDLTGLEFVAFMTELHGFSPDEAKRRAEKALGDMDLTAAQGRRMGEYSKGMRQRAKLAQAFAHDPEVIFLDEPLTGCDPLARVRIIDVIKRLGGDGKCVIVSSHVLHEIEAMTSEIVLIHKGQVLAEGNVYEIREMIDRHPHKIRVQCDRPRALASALVADEGVLGISFDEGAVLVETRQPDTCYPLIPTAARTAGVKIASLTSPDNNLQAVFRYLTEEKQAQAGVQNS